MNRSLNIRFQSAPGLFRQAEEPIGSAIQLPQDGPTASVRVPVSITRLSEDMRTEERQELMVPLTNGLIIRDLAPGRWLVKARLPSGESLSTTAHVPQDAVETEAVFDLAEFWEKLSVQLPSTGEVLPERVLRSPVATFSSPADPTVPTLRLGAGKLPKRGDGSLLETSPSSSPDGSLAFEATLKCDPRRPWWLTVSFGETETAWRVPPSARGRNTRALIRQVVSNGESNQERAARWDVRFDFGNDQAVALLGYLENTTLSVARRVGIDFIETASELLVGKAQDVTGAIVAGYFLQQAVDWRVGTSVGRMPISRLKGLLHNLAKMKGPESDGQIIFGHWLLDAGQVEEAKAMFLEAQSRGIPLFAMGLRALSRGLGVIHAAEEGGDPKVAAALVDISKTFQQLQEGTVSVALDVSEGAPTTG